MYGVLCLTFVRDARPARLASVRAIRMNPYARNERRWETNSSPSVASRREEASGTTRDPKARQNRRTDSIRPFFVGGSGSMKDRRDLVLCRLIHRLHFSFKRYFVRPQSAGASVLRSTRQASGSFGLIRDRKYTRTSPQTEVRYSAQRPVDMLAGLCSK